MATNTSPKIAAPLSKSELKLLASDFDFEPELLQKVSALHWLDTPEQRTRIVADAYTLLVPLLPNPAMALRRHALAVRVAITRVRAFDSDFCARDGLSGTTEEAFIRNLARTCLIRQLEDHLNVGLYIETAARSRALLQFDPALLVRIPLLFQFSLGQNLSAVSPALRKRCAVVNALYETPEERYHAFTAMVDADNAANHDILVLPGDLAPQ